MSILLSIVLALNVAPVAPQVPVVTDLTYGETFACAALADVGLQVLTGEGTTPVTTSEISLVNALTRLKTSAESAMEPARLRDGWDETAAETARTIAIQALGEASEDDLINALAICGTIFGVTFE